MANRPWLGIVLAIVVAGCSASKPPMTHRERVLAELRELVNSLPTEGGLSRLSQKDSTRIHDLMEELAQLPSDGDAALSEPLVKSKPEVDPELRELLAWLESSREREATPAEDAVSAEPADASANDTYSFGLQTRDYQLWLHAGSEQLYTVKTREGQVLARAIDDARLERDYPELHHLMHSGVDDVDNGIGTLGYFGTEER